MTFPADASVWAVSKGLPDKSMELKTTSARAGTLPGGRQLHRMHYAGLMLALLMIATPVVCRAQTLGDVARDSRAQTQQSGTAPAKVITNEDLAETPEAQPAVDAVEAPHQDATTPAKTGTKKKTPAATDHAQNPASPEKAEETPAPTAHDVIEKDFKRRAAALRDQIASVQNMIAKLMGQYINRWTIPDRVPQPDVAFREQQAMSFNQHLTDLIDEQKKLLADLTTQMKSLMEDARHAGVKLKAN